jgi:hypothetical protein
MKYCSNITLRLGLAILVGIASNGLSLFGQSDPLFISAQGNVGIGTSTPSTRLEVNGGVKISGNQSLNVNDQFSVSGSGNVGIGTTTPKEKLDLLGGNMCINDGLIFFRGNGNYDHSMGYEPSIDGPKINGKGGVQIDVNNEAIARFKPGRVYLGSSSKVINLEIYGSMHISSNLKVGNVGLNVTQEGKVGIGTVTPRAPLEVNASNGYTTDKVQTVWFSIRQRPLAYGKNETTKNVQIIAKGWIQSDGDGFIATSDARIKRQIGISDAQTDLATLQQIQVTDYHLVDSVLLGTLPQKKVIAQQVQSVYPQAVIDGQTGVIPNVYGLANKVLPQDATTELEMGRSHGLATGDVVQFYLADGTTHLLPVHVLDATRFSVAQRLEGPVFVYGKQVSDLLAVDYDAIAMLNVSATQALAQQVAQLQAQQQVQTALIDQLRTQLDAVKAKLEASVE